MNIVLVSVFNFQEYILVNIKQLIHLGHKSIYVITDRKFFEKYDEFSKSIHLVDPDTLLEIYNYKAGKNIDTHFRNGFWELTSKRLFLVHSFMKQYNMEDVIHLENDVLVYYDCESLIKNLDRKKICFPVDTSYRAIASIMYIPNHEIFGFILAGYNNNLTDMHNLACIQRRYPNLFENFPICFQKHEFTDEQKYVTRLFKKFDMIFDGAAIGQYLGGIDPRNTSNENTEGFVSKECVIKYDNFEFIWKKDNGVKRPFMQFNDEIFPIFNLHIHSKNLTKFTSF